MKFLGGIGLGTFPLSNVFSRVDDVEAKRLFQTFLDSGAKYIQTAPYYEGVDDRVAALLTGRPRDDYYLCTLCVKGRDGKREGRYEAIVEQCDDSLQHLKVNYIDLYLTSTTKAADASLDETMNALVDLRKQGKIKEIGVSNVSLDDLKQYNRHEDVRFVQNRFSLLNASIASEFHDYCASHGIEFIPYQVIERGLLTSQVLEGIHLRAGDLREKKPEFRDEAVTVIRQWVSDELNPIATSVGASVEALIISWTLHQRNIALCVIGATKAAQMTRVLSAQTFPMTADTIDRVNESYEHLASLVREKYSQTVQAFLGNVY